MSDLVFEPMPDTTYQREAEVIKGRMDALTDHGFTITLDRVIGWIRARHPAWTAGDYDRVIERLPTFPNVTGL